MTIDDALAAYLLQLDADGRSPHTRAQVGRHVRALARWLAASGLCDDVGAITPEVLARFMTSPAARVRPDGAPKKASSANAMRTSLRCFFLFVHTSGFSASNAARLVRRARCGQAPPRGINEPEAARLLEAVAAGTGRAALRDHLLFHLLLASGLRIGSALALDVGDVDLADGTIEVRVAKGGRRGRVFLSPAIREHLHRALAGRTAGPLFEACAGRRMCARQAAKRLGLWLKRAGIQRRASPHSLRHAFAMRMLARTGNLGLVQRALGHASIASTVVYARASDEDVRRAMGA